MKQILFCLALSFLILSPVIAADDFGLATDNALVAPPPDTDSAAQLFLGQQHNYTVTMRGNGEAVVYARIAFTNFSETNLNSIRFKTEASLNDLIAFQQVLPDVCKKQVYDQETKTYNCLKYSTADYYKQQYSYYYYNRSSNENAKYNKIKFSQVGDQYEFSLTSTIKPDFQGAILLAYRSKNYVDKKAFGLFKFHFTTLTAPVKVNDINVAIQLDSELYMKGQKSEVNYKSVSLDESVGLGATESFANPTLDSLSSELGYSGIFRKTAKDLSPDESFTVNGKYATTKFRLYLLNIIIGGLILIALIIALYFLNKHFANKNNEPKPSAPVPPITVAPAKQAAGKDERINLFNGQYVVWSFVSSLLMFFLSYSLNWIDDVNWYNIIPNGTEFILVVGFIIIILIYAFLVFGIPVIFASKHGWRAFVSVLLDIILISAILFVILIGILTTI